MKNTTTTSTSTPWLPDFQAFRKAERMKKREYARPLPKPHLARVRGRQGDVYEDMLATSQALIGKVIRTLESNGFTFSRTDLADMRQAGQLALVQIGFYESGIVDKNTFRAVSRAIEGRECMRLNCKWESTHEKFNTLEEIGAMHEWERGEAKGKLPKATRDALRSCFDALRHAREASQSRKAQSEYLGQRNFLVQVIASNTGKGGIEPINPATFRKRKSRFLPYLREGAKHLSQSRNHCESLANDILRNLERNFATA